MRHVVYSIRHLLTRLGLLARPDPVAQAPPRKQKPSLLSDKRVLTPQDWMREEGLI